MKEVQSGDTRLDFRVGGKTKEIWRVGLQFIEEPAGTILPLVSGTGVQVYVLPSMTYR
jgi:hypothetical protein